MSDVKKKDFSAHQWLKMARKPKPSKPKPEKFVMTPAKEKIKMRLLVPPISTGVSKASDSDTYVNAVIIVWAELAEEQKNPPFVFRKWLTDGLPKFRTMPRFAGLSDKQIEDKVVSTWYKMPKLDDGYGYGLAEIVNGSGGD